VTSKTYVVPDLHGRFDLLETALARIEAAPPGRVVFTGDYIDRGPQSREVLERLIAGPQLAGWRWICLKGNHEDMLIQASADPRKLRWWLDNGGDATLISYGRKRGEAADASRIDPVHIEWMRALPLFFEDAFRLYVHAGVDEGVPLSEQSHNLMWKRYRPDIDVGYGDLHVVHGHDPAEDGPKLFARRTDLDTGAFFTGRLVVGVFDDDIPGGPAALVESVV
jgi:diadenosine tetraphosphatase ApaH/serine/threonine PP2A family protein phosphatase